MTAGGGAPQAELQDLLNNVPSYADASAFGQYSPYYRDPALGQLSPDQILALQDTLRQYISRAPATNYSDPNAGSGGD